MTRPRPSLSLHLSPILCMRPHPSLSPDTRPVPFSSHSTATQPPHTTTTAANPPVRTPHHTAPAPRQVRRRLFRDGHAVAGGRLTVYEELKLDDVPVSVDFNNLSLIVFDSHPLSSTNADVVVTAHGWKGAMNFTQVGARWVGAGAGLQYLFWVGGWGWWGGEARRSAQVYVRRRSGQWAKRGLGRVATAIGVKGPRRGGWGEGLPGWNVSPA